MPLPIIVGLVFAQTGLVLPEVVDKPLHLLSNAFGPVALLLVGVTLVQVRIGQHLKSALGIAGIVKFKPSSDIRLACRPKCRNLYLARKQASVKQTRHNALDDNLLILRRRGKRSLVSGWYRVSAWAKDFDPDWEPPDSDASPVKEDKA